MLYLLLAGGFEEIEALGTVDFLRRCGIEVRMASTIQARVVTGAHGIPVMTDCLVRRNDIEQSDGVILPGGMPGAEALRTNAVVGRIVQAMSEQQKLLAAICAAPMVLGNLGLLKGKKATCYPGFEEWLKGATLVKDTNVVEDENVITAAGPGFTIDFATAIARRFVSDNIVQEVRKGMLIYK